MKPSKIMRILFSPINTIILVVGVFFLLCFLFYLFYSTPFIFSKPKEDISVDQISYLENIPVLNIHGEGYELGYQNGALFKDPIQNTVDILKKDIIYENRYIGFILHAYLLFKARQLESYIPDKYKLEMLGVAKGANVSYSDILLINLYDDLLYLSSCSSIAVLKGNSSEYLYHARNLDYPLAQLAGKTVIVNYDDGKLVNIAFPGYIGVLTATNDKGLTLTTHTAFARNNKIGMPTGILYRKILDESSNITDVDNILNQANRTIGNNILVSSVHENNAVVFEISANKIGKRSAENNTVYTTNHYLTNELKDEEVIETNNSLSRFTRLEEFAGSMNACSLVDLKGLMQEYKPQQGSWNTLSNTGTVQAAIFVPELKTVYVAKGSSPPVTSAGYAEYKY